MWSAGKSCCEKKYVSTMTKGFGFSVLLFPHLFEGIERKIVLE